MRKKLTGLMMVRNEDWILGFSARVALRWCDELVIFDHNSTDRSQQIEMDVAAEHPGRVHLMGPADPLDSKWDEMVFRQQMLDQARAKGATHVAIIDADEIATANILDVLPRLIKGMVPQTIMQTPLYNLRRGWSYHINGIWGHRIVSLALKDDAFVKWQGDTFHKREPLESYQPFRPFEQLHGGVMHFWGMSERRLKAKHAWYKVTERLRWPDREVSQIDQMYSLAIRPVEGHPAWTYKEVPQIWLKGYDELANGHLNLQATPWQEQVVRDLVAANHWRTFRGLDLFGVDKAR